MMKTEIVLETSVSTKAEPHHPAENPKELLHENSLVRRKNIKMRVKVKLFLCSTKHHALKKCWSGGISPGIFDLGIRRR
jgi:hypothetical protein